MISGINTQFEGHDLDFWLIKSSTAGAVPAAGRLNVSSLLQFVAVSIMNLKPHNVLVEYKQRETGLPLTPPPTTHHYLSSLHANQSQSGARSMGAALHVCVEREKIYFVMNTIYEVISFMQTSGDESKNLYKL